MFQNSQNKGFSMFPAQEMPGVSGNTYARYPALAIIHCMHAQKISHNIPLICRNIM